MIKLKYFCTMSSINNPACTHGTRDDGYSSLSCSPFDVTWREENLETVMTKFNFTAVSLE
jgi:hypothetical protein